MAHTTFRRSVTLGDIDGDGRQDLAIGAPDENMRFFGSMHYHMGTVTVLYGSPAGVDTTTAPQYFYPGNHGVPGEPLHVPQFGTAVLLSDLDRDGGADLLVGAPWMLNGDGAVTVLPSAVAPDGSRRIGTTGAIVLAPRQAGMDTTGVPQFGSVLQNSRQVSLINT
ncbi:FG-GAP repeat protein [Streptomyces sp. NPDC005728]|uniref:FG-GAP repeat protein n=1 Tax=Streptomyces sp. NPDC005728 TaxID=3157054 RepID=UPI0033E9ACDF